MENETPKIRPKRNYTKERIAMVLGITLTVFLTTKYLRSKEVIN